MQDLISRQAAIDAVCKACSLEGDYHKCDGYPETSTWCDELVALRALPSAQPGWIPCSERLPEDGERVLATHLGGLNPDRQVIEHIYKNVEFTLGWDMDMNINSPTFGQRYMGKVVAWMPLPEPYGGEQNEAN